MSRTYVLRIPRSDGDDGSFVLAHVTPSASKKAKALDLKLVGTDGEDPYSVSLQHNKIDSLRSSSSACSSEEWERILASVLLESGTVEDVELTAAVRSTAKHSNLEITVRKRIQGITQRLGVISLPRNDNEEDTDVTVWCGIAVAARDEARADLASVKRQTQDLEATVASLKDQLEELIKAKDEHESELLEKFRDLLNSKKAKIREQQKALVAVGADPAAMASIQSSRKQTSAAGHKPVASRRSKRKADLSEPSVDDGSEDGVERMEVDVVKQEYLADNPQDQSEEDRHTTDSHDEDEDVTASEAESDDDDASAASVSKQAAASSRTEAAGKPSKGKQEQKEKTPTLEDLPPKRVLPFTTRKGPPLAQKSSNQPKLEQGSETESDDEL